MHIEGYVRTQSVKLWFPQRKLTFEKPWRSTGWLILRFAAASALLDLPILTEVDPFIFEQ